MSESHVPGSDSRDNDELSRLYREGAVEEPGATIDQNILARARTTAGQTASKTGFAIDRSLPPFGRHGQIGWSIAAVVVLSISLVTWLPETELTDPAGVMSRETGETAPRGTALHETESGRSASAALPDTPTSDHAAGPARQSRRSRQKQAEPEFTRNAVSTTPVRIQREKSADPKPVEGAGVRQQLGQLRPEAKKSVRKVTRAIEMSNGSAGVPQVTREAAARVDSSPKDAVERANSAGSNVEAAPSTERKERFQAQPSADLAKTQDATKADARPSAMSPPPDDRPAALGTRSDADAPPRRVFGTSTHQQGTLDGVPAQWLAEIANLLDHGQVEAARQLYERFRQQHPTFVVDDDLLNRLGR